MNLHKLVLKELDRLKIKYNLKKEIDSSLITSFDLSSYPKCYEQVLFNIDWPETMFYILHDDVKDDEIDLENFDFDDEELWECIEYHQIELWNNKGLHNRTNTFNIKHEHSFGDNKYFQIGQVHQNYNIFLCFNSITSDGNPEIQFVYPYEKAGENIYFEETLSVFLSKLVEIKDMNSKSHGGSNNLCQEIEKWIELKEGSYELLEGGGLSVDFASSSIRDIENISELDGLEELNISNTFVVDLSPLEKQSKLKKLDISWNSIDNLSHIKLLNTLEELYIYSTDVKDIKILKELSNLKKLNCFNINIEDISVLENLTQLEELNLSYTKVINIKPISKLKNLKSLRLDGLKLKDFSALKNLEKLEFISIKGAHVDASEIQKLNSLFKNCTIEV